MNEIVRACDALLVRCAEIEKSSRWKEVEELKQEAINWFRRAGLPRENWWGDLQDRAFAVAADCANSHVRNSRFAAQSGVVSGASYQERFLHYHMDGVRELARRLEDARSKIEADRQRKKRLKDLSDLERTIIALLRSYPALRQRELCAKVDAAFERAHREVPLLRSWKARAPKIRSMQDAFDSPILHRMVKSYISKRKGEDL